MPDPLPTVAPPGPTLPPDGAGRRFELHAFVCVSDSACNRDGPAEAIQRHLKARLREAGVKESLRVNKSGCLGQCGHGPMMVVYPEGVWYSHLDLDGAERVWREHIVGGRPVDDLRFRTPRGGTNVVPFRSRDDRTPDTASPYWEPCSRCPVR